MKQALAGTLLAGVLSLAGAPSGEAGPKILLLCDMEGVTGVTNAEDVNFGSANYSAARESLTEDVNAAIRGILIGGASEVVLTDGHGSGNPEPDYLLDRLPNGARFDIRPRPYDPYIESVDTTYGAVVAIGMHGRAAGRGFLAHTFTGSTRWVAAGYEMNESMILAASAARFDIPLILVTGDDVLHKELAEFTPKTRYVVVKRAVSTTEAAPMPRAQVTAEIEAEAARAVRNIADVPPWRPAGFEAPFTNEFGYTMPEQASIAIRYPGAESMNDKTIRLRSDSFVDAYLAFRALAGFTALVRPTLMLQSLQQVDGGPKSCRSYSSGFRVRSRRSSRLVPRYGQSLGRGGTA